MTRFSCEPVAALSRNKVRRQTDLIVHAVANARAGNITILSVGCGPSRDVRDAITAGVPPERLTLVLNDIDSAALEFAADRLLDLGVAPEHLHTRCANVLSFARHACAAGPFDLILAG